MAGISSPNSGEAVAPGPGAGHAPSMGALARKDCSPSTNKRSKLSGLLARCGESASLADQLSPSQTWVAGKSEAESVAFEADRRSSCAGISGVANTDGISGNAEIAFPRHVAGRPLRFKTNAFPSKWVRMRPAKLSGLCACAESNSAPCKAVELLTGSLREKSPS